jgi:hypothetical protein
MSTFRRELREIINKHSKENGSDTPDFILAEYLTDCLRAYDKAVRIREHWYGKETSKTNEKNEFCQCEKPDREMGYTYCMRCHKHVSDARMRFLVNKNEVFYIPAKEEDPEEIKRRQQRNDYEYNNLCARATLYPGKSIEEVKLLQKEQKFEEVYKEINEKLLYNMDMNDVKTREWVKDTLRKNFLEAVLIKCDDENNPPEIIDLCLLVAQVIWNSDYSNTWQHKNVSMIFGDPKQVEKYQRQHYLDNETFKFIEKGI